MRNKDFLNGLKSGVPIGLGYFAVSFTFGIMAIVSGLNWWQATIISMLTLTSAGQVAGVGVMAFPGMYIDMLVSQLTINMRYAFMSIALSQKINPKFKGIFKALLGFFITDEIFAVAITKGEISRSFFFGLSVSPYFGWAIGTLLGAVLGNILPSIVMSALCIAIYGMFVAAVVPNCKKNLNVLIVVLIGIVLSCCFYYLPILSEISSGISISICAVLAAIIGAIFFPRKEENINGN